MQCENWPRRAKKPATIMVTGLMGMILCMIANCTNVIMHASVALFTAGLIGFMEQHKQRSNR